MVRDYRCFPPAGWLVGTSAATLALVAAWGAPTPEKAAPAQTRAVLPTAPGAANEAASAAAQPLVKPSETPHLLFLFTDQVVGYIQPCG